MARYPHQRDLLAAHAAASRVPAPKQADLLTGELTRPAYYGKRVTPGGYAARPGTGPAGETCGSCRHCVYRTGHQRYYKCNLMMASWSRGRGTDVAYRSPACALWEPTA